MLEYSTNEGSGWLGIWTAIPTSVIHDSHPLLTRKHRGRNQACCAERRDGALVHSDNELDVNLVMPREADEGLQECQILSLNSCLIRLEFLAVLRL
jgi:hypothetical protein